MYFFVSYKGEGFFELSKQFGYSWKKVKLEKWNNKMSVIVESLNAGMNNDEERNIKERYILDDGKAQLVESMKKISCLSWHRLNQQSLMKKVLMKKSLYSLIWMKTVSRIKLYVHIGIDGVRF